VQEQRTDAQFSAFLKALDTLALAPDPDERLVNAALAAIGPALNAFPIIRSDAIRCAIDEILPSSAIGLKERCIDRCDRHDAIVAIHTCLSCDSPSYEMHVVRRPLKQGECRLCASCRDRALAQGKKLLCDMPIKGSCGECPALMTELYCVGSDMESLTERTCAACALKLIRQGWRSIVISHIA